MSVVDLRCFRLLTFSPEGAVKVLQLPHDLESEPSSAVLPQWISAPPDGSLWFSGLRVVGEKIDSVVGHATPDGAVSYLPLAEEPTTLAAAPDGSVWTVLAGCCTLARVRDGRIDRFHAPFRVFHLRFAADGGAWLWGDSRLLHRNAAELEAIPRAKRCDTGIPRSTLPDSRHRTISLATLRRSGLRVRSSQPAEFSGRLRLAGRLVYVRTVIRRSGSTVSVPLPAALLDRAGRRLRGGRRVELHLGLVELRNADGNIQVHTEPYRIVP